MGMCMAPSPVSFGVGVFLDCARINVDNGIGGGVSGCSGWAGVGGGIAVAEMSRAPGGTPPGRLATAGLAGFAVGLGGCSVCACVASSSLDKARRRLIEL